MAFKHIDYSQAEELLSNHHAILVDIRDEESFNLSHHERAINLSQWSLPQFLFETDRDMPVLVLCYHGNSSQTIAEFLSQQGFQHVHSIDGGYEGWK
ncbi:thiosulfate sulfurtransferase GlpE [Dysgonomonas sp. 521]|uniref:thiosulfate sulfurtransferase GlpE n=1 Tax=Dysgonomonas sp. 521 TaxID=2302932 RepID=UPI0013D538E1|nr:thiosulfate sulfurtransferase GlpE [Dysgonomonas sp. 521]NDV95262.1 thiosulfate sulfurtransferase GlpE [Dysgonomonas sp. 521]